MSKLPKSTLAKSAKFNHQAHADRLEQLNTQAQAARRVDVALGLYCFELKEIHLQYGQFGKWLAEYRPALAEKHSTNGNWQPSGSLETAMWMANSALKVCGYQIGDYIELVQTHFPSMQGKCDSGQLMLLPAAELPKEFKKLRDEIFDLVDGKSQRQLRAEFKQINEATQAPQRGRAKGSSGLTAEMRELAAQREEEERLNTLDEWMDATSAELVEKADAKHVGCRDSERLVKLQTACQTMSGFIQRLLAARKNNGGAE